MKNTTTHHKIQTAKYDSNDRNSKKKNRTTNQFQIQKDHTSKVKYSPTTHNNIYVQNDKMTVTLNNTQQH